FSSLTFPLSFRPFLSLPPPPPTSTLFPYTTLFRSVIIWRISVRPEGSPIMAVPPPIKAMGRLPAICRRFIRQRAIKWPTWRLSRSEEHTSELQSRFDLVCRLLLEKKKNKQELRKSR